MRIFIFLILFLTISFSKSAFANKEDLQKGWDSFFENKREEAKKYFQLAVKSADTKAEASLGLSLLAKEVDNAEEAFKYFQDFFNGSENPLPYTYALWTTACVNSDYSEKRPEQVKFLQQLLANPKANLMMKAMTSYVLGKHYERTGDFAKATDYYKQIGSVNDWKVVGTFENISASGFDKDYAPIHAKSDQETYKNKVGAPIQWFDSPSPRKDQWTDFAYFFYYQNSIMFSQTFINSPSQRDAVLRIGTSGSLKVWLNDKRVASFSEETNNDMDTYLLKVKLNKGYNRLLLQIGESEDIGACNYMVRITDVNEKLFSDISFSKDFQQYSTSDTAYKVDTYNNPYEEFFQKKIKEEPKNVLNYILLAEAYARNEKKQETRKVLKEAKKIAPNSSYVAYQFLSLYIKTKNRTLLSEEIEWMKEHDPKGYFSLTYQVEEAFEKENYDEAKGLLDKIEEIYGVENKSNDQYLLNNRIKIAAQKEQIEEMVKLVNQAYKKFPTTYTVVNMKALMDKALSKDTKKSIAIWEKYVDKSYSETAYENLAGNYFDIAKVDKGFKIYDMLIKNEPLAVGYIYALGEKYFNLQQYSKAAECYQKCIKQSPYISDYWSALGQSYEEMGKKDEAKEAYKKCLTYRPTSYKVREKLRNLESKKDIFTYFDSVDVYKLVKNAPNAKEYPDDNSVILAHTIQKVIYGDGASESKEVIVIKTLNKQGVDDWKQYAISYNGYSQKLIVEKAEVVKANGSKTTAEKNDNDIVFTSLEPGDAIHITYRIQDFYSGSLAKQFWDKQYMSGSYPSKVTSYNLLVNKNMKFSYKMLNGDIKPSQKDIEDLTLYTWETKDEPSIKPERYMPAYTDVAKILFISSIPDWKFIANWYIDLSKTKAKAEYEVKEALDEMFAGKTNLTQLQKAKMIYQYVVENVRYSSVSFRQSGYIPQKATTTLNTKLGDCKDVSTLYASMCREVGIPASLLLVNTRDNGKNDMLLPSVDFNHCTVKINADGKDYFVELTSDKVPFSVLPSEDKKAFALVIDKNTESPITINPENRPKNELIRTVDVTFEGTTMMVKKKSTRTGNYVSGLKESYLQLSKEEREKQMLESIASDYPAKMKLTSLEFMNLDSLADTMYYNYSFSVNDPFTRIGGLSICKLPWSDRIESIDFLSSETRKYPIEYWEYTSADREIETLTISIPHGKTITDMPKSQKYSCFLADYSIQYKLQGNKIVATREFIFKDDFVPVEKYNELKDFYAKVVTADAEQIAFK
ncbi:MAG: tetratricopeptide repeat protein [Bacteroidetes bacterium]|nr:tetratricopeptide repeat protein [Bacteroidota bacterium]